MRPAARGGRGRAPGAARPRHLRGEAEAGRQGPPGVLGELGRRRERRPPAARLDPRHRRPHPRARLQRGQRGLPRHPLRRHRAVGGRFCYSTVKVPTPAEMCQAKQDGLTVLMSIGGAAAGIDLNSTAVADRFVATIVPLLKKYNFDGIDIDIETGLVGSGSITRLSPSQANLIRIIDGVLAQMPAGFGLTMAPETAYVTGGSVAYGSIWGAYLPVVKKYADNGRLWWLNMQYYNGSMYGCSGDSYSAGTVAGFKAQTDCLDRGLVVQGTTVRVPYDKQVPGLPAQPGAGGGYMAPGLVAQAWNPYGGRLKGLMTWSLNWDGSRNWTFGDNVRALQGR
ncbi:endochitinase [Streptomyces sp. C]|nr:endochitinase [Streptomyces sp. C]